jgi:hypothetical protein
LFNPTHAQEDAHEWGTRAFVLRRTDGEAGSLREWKERKAKAETTATADSSAALRNDKNRSDDRSFVLRTVSNSVLRRVLCGFGGLV